MRVLSLTDGLLTNVEALELLRQRTGEFGALAAYPQPHDPFPTELQCYDALRRSPAGAQTVEHVREFIERVRPIELTAAEVLQVINLRPRERVVVHAVVASCGERLTEDEVDDLLDLVDQYL